MIGFLCSAHIVPFRGEIDNAIAGCVLPAPRSPAHLPPLNCAGVMAQAQAGREPSGAVRLCIGPLRPRLLVAGVASGDRWMLLLESPTVEVLYNH